MKSTDYVKKENLTTSYIDATVLYQCRPLKPERKYVGVTDKGEKVYFEETRGSLKNRHYGRKDVSSWNLLYITDKANKIDETWLESATIDFADGYDKNILENFLKTNNKVFNALTGKKSEKKQRSIWLTDDEYPYVIEFIKRMRKIRGGN